MSATLTHAELMKEIGSKEGFDPMPPTQHGWFLDVRESMTSRAIAWLWSKTIRPGRGNRRSPFARDQRGVLALKHVAADLGWTLSNASAVFKKLEEQGRVRRDERGRICLRGDVPEPERIDGEDATLEASHGQDEKEAFRGGEEKGDVISTWLIPQRLLSYFQQHTKSESQRWAGDYQRIQEYRQKLESDAIAAARAKGREIENKFLVAIGFESEAQQRVLQKGRPRVERQETVQLSLLAVPELSVHITSDLPVLNSVQNANGYFVQPKNGSVHITPSLLTSENRVTELASEEKPETELENAIREVIARTGLRWLNGKEINDFTVGNIRLNLERLPAERVKEVLETLEHKCRHLERRPYEARERTWGWIVAIVKREANRILDGGGVPPKSARFAAAAAGSSASPEPESESDRGPVLTAEEIRKQALELAAVKKMR